MFLNCEGNELASGFNLPFKFSNQIVKKKLFSCVKTETQITWTLAEEGRTRSKASRQLSENLVFVLIIIFCTIYLP